MNPQFEPFVEFIRECREYPQLNQDDIEDSPDGRELMRRCDEHASRYVTGRIGTRNIVAVHPFFDKIYSGFYSEETKRLVSLLIEADNKMFSRVLLESYLDYPEGGSELAEESLIDRVIFTIPDNGIPVRDDEMGEFGISRENYVCGCYGDGCVKTVMHEIRRHAPRSSVTRPISDTTLFSSIPLPSNGKRFADYLNYGGCWSFRRFCQLSSLLRGVTSSELLQTQGGYNTPRVK